jgi:hypothetical protein
MVLNIIKGFFLYLLRWSRFFCLCCLYIYRFAYVEPPLHPWDEANLVIINDLSDMLLDLVWPTEHWTMCCSTSKYSHVFYCCFCCWVLVLMHCDQIECMALFLFSYICWGLLCALRYDQFWTRFHGLLRRMYIVQKLDEIFCRHQLGLFDLWCDLVLDFLYLLFVGWPIYWW